MNNSIYKPLVIWLFTGCFLIFSMVVIGGITRLTHSGLSMVEWNLVMGAIPPLNEQQWQDAFEKYKQFPEYQRLHYHFTVDDFKSIFWWEYIHRMVGRLIGIVFIIPFLIFWAKGKISKSLMPKLLIIFAMGAFQGFLGWYMVKSGLVDKPFVSHYRLAIHLMAAFITFGFTFWVALGEIYRNETKNPRKSTAPIYRLSLVFMILLLIQIVYGAFVAGLKAGYVYNTFPLMGDQFVPDSVVSLDPVYLNFLEGMAGVQFVHRSLAYILFILAGVIFFKARKLPLNRQQKAGVQLLAAMVIVQMLLGIFTLIWAVPITLGVLHQVGAFFLLAFNLYLVHRLKPKSINESVSTPQFA